MNNKENPVSAFKEEIKGKMLGSLGFTALIGGITLMATYENQPNNFIIGTAASVAGALVLKLSDNIIETTITNQNNKLIP